MYYINAILCRLVANELFQFVIECLPFVHNPSHFMFIIISNCYLLIDIYWNTPMNQEIFIFEQVTNEIFQKVLFYAELPSVFHSAATKNALPWESSIYFYKIPSIHTVNTHTKLLKNFTLNN